MNRRGPDMLVFRTHAAARLCFGMVLMALCGQCSAQEPTAEEITQRLLDWQHSFATLRIVYEVRNPSQWLVRKPELANSGDINQYFRRCEWIYSDTGSMRHEMCEYEGGILKKRLLEGIHRNISYIATFQTDFADAIGITIARAPPLSEYASTPILPLSQLRTSRGEWLGDILGRSTPVVRGVNVIDNATCIEIRRGADSRYALWLDMGHDYLPRLNEPDRSIKGTRFHVEEFLQLNNGRWLPSKGTEVSAKENQPYYWVVTEAEVNKQLPDSLFAPPKPGPETQLYDRAGYFGPAASAKILPRENNERPVNPPPPLPNGLPVSATIPRTNWGWLALAAIIPLVAVLFWTLWRKRS